MGVSGMITSKVIIENIGISRATLNNYIKLGILPRPVVGPPPPEDKGIKQIGYFPEEVIARLDKVRLFKSQGRSMDEIARLFREDSAMSAHRTEMPLERDRLQSTAKNHNAALSEPRPYTRAADRQLKVTICDIDSPAYLINRHYEVEWINRQAEDLLFNKKVRSLVDRETRNIFRLFLEQRSSGRHDEWIDLVSLHLTILQEHIDESVLGSIYKDITPQEVSVLKDLFRSRIIARHENAFCLPISMSRPGSILKQYRVHTMTFREGTFFIYIPTDDGGSELLAMLGQRERVINDLLKHRMPSLVSLCVLIADLQDSVRISAELLPSQYFELINGLWECVGPAIENHRGIYGKHVGDGMLYYFLDKPGDNYIVNCINCAIEIREIVKKFSNKWKGIKGWDNDLYLNTGINEGQEFFGTIRSADNIEFTALGDTINVTARLTEFARNGEIWTTKNLISKLSQEERNMFRFGVHSKKRPGNGFIRDSFSRLSDLITEDNPHCRKLNAIGGLPITEIKERLSLEID